MLFLRIEICMKTPLVFLSRTRIVDETGGKNESEQGKHGRNREDDYI